METLDISSDDVTNDSNALFTGQEFNCNGTVIDHPEYGEVVQLQGDQRGNIAEFLTRIKLCEKSQLNVHGF